MTDFLNVNGEPAQDREPEEVARWIEAGDFARIGRLAHSDPGAFTDRRKVGDQLEELHAWQGRAAVLANLLARGAFHGAVNAAHESGITVGQRMAAIQAQRHTEGEEERREIHEAAIAALTIKDPTGHPMRPASVTTRKGDNPAVILHYGFGPLVVPVFGSRLAHLLALAIIHTLGADRMEYDLSATEETELVAGQVTVREVVVEGHSDDLVCVKGPGVSEEFDAIGRPTHEHGWPMVFSDGTELRIDFDPDGTGNWRIHLAAAGTSSEVTIVRGDGEDGTDTCTVKGASTSLTFRDQTLQLEAARG